jgi:hypothetical protein
VFDAAVFSQRGKHTQKSDDEVGIQMNKRDAAGGGGAGSVLGTRSETNTEKKNDDVENTMTMRWT